MNTKKVGKKKVTRKIKKKTKSCATKKINFIGKQKMFQFVHLLNKRGFQENFVFCIRNFILFALQFEIL
jgi:hypothetical protein